MCTSKHQLFTVHGTWIKPSVQVCAQLPKIKRKFIKLTNQQKLMVESIFHEV